MSNDDVEKNLSVFVSWRRILHIFRYLTWKLGTYFLLLSLFVFCRRLRAYESHLSTVALSNVESSRTVSQILYDMANAQDFP